jgi:hypothetical protein
MQAAEPGFVRRAVICGRRGAASPRLSCGTVAVPRDHAHPQAGTFDLAVVVVKSEAAKPSRTRSSTSARPGRAAQVYARHRRARPTPRAAT